MPEHSPCIYLLAHSQLISSSSTMTTTYTYTHAHTMPQDIELEPVRPAYTPGRDKLRNSDPDLFSGRRYSGPTPGQSIPSTPSALSAADALSLSHIDASLGGERVTPVLHPPDKGRHAWQFLAAATLVETTVWGLPVCLRSSAGQELTAVHGRCPARVLAHSHVSRGREYAHPRGDVADGSDVHEHCLARPVSQMDGLGLLTPAYSRRSRASANSFRRSA